MNQRQAYSEGYEAVKVSVKPFETNIAEMFWDAFKMTWVSLQDVPYDPNDQRVINGVLDVVERRALQSPKESIKFQFKIENISRVCLAQITRGRIGWWYVVESQMPEYMNHGVTIPLNFIGTKYESQIKDLIKQSQNLYDEMSRDGYPPQDLRYLCIHGQQTSMVADCNFAALPGFFALRAENGLTDELNLVARLIKLRIIEYVFAQELDNLNKTVWAKLLDQLDCMGAKQETCVNFDRVFGNTGRFEKESPHVPQNPDFDFKKSAWYLELQKLPENLLFPGEKEMIEGWKNEKD